MNLLVESPAKSPIKFPQAFWGLSHLQKALAIALLLHLLLLALLPPLPVFNLNGLDSARVLIVTLSKESQEPEFNSSLDQQLPLAADVDQVATPSLGAQSVDPAEDTLVSDDTELNDLNGSENSEKTTNGNLASQNDKPSIRFDFAAIRLFAKNEAFRYAEYQPRKVERFARAFNRTRSVYRRNSSESYRNQVGDIYARSNSSVGDVCFKQRQDYSESKQSTNIVFFFRCDSKPIGFNLKNNKVDQKPGKG